MNSTSAWIKIPLGRLAKKLVNGGTPPTTIPKFWTGKIPWITGADFTASGLGDFRRYISDEAVSSSSTNVVSKGEILIVTRTGVGKIAVTPCDVAISQDITGFFVDKAAADPDFLFHRLKVGVDDLKKLNQGTSINGIIRDDLVKYEIDLPPLPAQSRIAEILSTLDETIEHTEALIAKHRQIMAGLMHDLFTRGVTPDGKLRPTRDEAPQLYKQSPLGWIPKEWGLAALSEVSDIRFSNVDKKSNVGERSVWLCNYMDVYANDYITSELRFMEATCASSEIERFGVKFGDVIITKDSETPDDIGVAAVVIEDIPGLVCGYHLAMIRPDAKTVSQVFLAKQIGTSRVASYFGRMANGSTRYGLSTDSIASLPVFLPKREEQIQVETKLLEVDTAITHEQEHLAKLRQQKQGLMHDLLTGKVPVGVLS